MAEQPVVEDKDNEIIQRLKAFRVAKERLDVEKGELVSLGERNPTLKGDIQGFLVAFDHYQALMFDVLEVAHVRIDDDRSTQP
jgi:hypothetical protein